MIKDSLEELEEIEYFGKMYFCVIYWFATADLLFSLIFDKKIIK